MTERIPRGLAPETWADRLILEAMERGEFDGLGGAGRPLALGDAGDPDWWVKRKLREEEFVALPPALELRRDRDRLLEAIENLPSEAAVRMALVALNGRILYANSHAIPGPPSTLMTMDVEPQVARWRAADPSRSIAPVAVAAPAAEPRRRWWWPWGARPGSSSR